MTNALIKLGSRDILGKTVTAFGTVENPLFDPAEVAEWLEYRKDNISHMLSAVAEDEKVLIEVQTTASSQRYESKKHGNLRTKRWFLTEYGLYETLMLSRKPQAKEFKKGVKQLLHDLRTGKTQITRQLSGDELILAAMNELQHRVMALTHTVEQQQAQIIEDAPKVKFANQIGDCPGGIGIREFGLVFRQNRAGFGQNGFVSRLLDGKFVYRDERKRLRPYAEHIETGLFWEKAVLISASSGDFQTFQVKITGKGQQYFLEKYLPRSILPAETDFSNSEPLLVSSNCCADDDEDDE